MEFDLLRLTLLQPEQIRIDERKDEYGESLSREAWLRIVLSEPIQFTHRKEVFHFVPISQEGKERPDLIAGRIGRLVRVQENMPPDRGLAETERETWHASLLLIDPTHHDDGQKIGFERDGSIGTPLRLMESLANQINNSATAEPYFMEIAPISDMQSFWDFASNNRGDVTHVTFEFLAPNMFGIHDDYDQEMADLRDKEKIRRAKLQIESAQGLELETERVKAAAKYTTRGGGGIKAKTRDGKKFDSKKKIKKVKFLQGKTVGQAMDDLISQVAGAIFRE